MNGQFFYIKRGCRSGMTLLEMLVVMALIALLLGMLIPAVGRVQDSIQLTKAATLIKDHLQLARQMAITRNEPIYVNFCQTTDSFNQKAFNLLVLTRITKSGGTEIIERPTALPTGFAISENSTWSSLIGTSDDWETIDLPRTAGQPCRRIRYTPAGTTTLPSGGSWYLTVQRFRSGEDLKTAVPGANFVTLSIDPVTGRVFSYQP